MRWVRSTPDLVTRDDDGPDILRIENCSEVDVAGNFFIQDGKYYDDCYDFENEDAPEGADLGGLPSWGTILVLVFFGVVFFTAWCGLIVFCFYRCVKNCPQCYNMCSNICYNMCCARCEPQPVVRNDNNASISTISTISNISTISANIRQPSRRPLSPSAPPSSEIQEDLFDRLPRSKASVDQCTGHSKYFF